jgi:hypothetical protein
MLSLSAMRPTLGEDTQMYIGYRCWSNPDGSGFLNFSAHDSVEAAALFALLADSCPESVYVLAEGDDMDLVRVYHVSSKMVRSVELVRLYEHGPYVQAGGEPRACEVSE